MHILFTDETNVAPSPQAKFFGYGGLIIPVGKLPLLHNRICEIRRAHGYEDCDTLKFDTNARPKNVTQDMATSAKNSVIDACIEFECKFIAYVVLHAIAKNQPMHQNVLWGADHVIGKFNYFLSEVNSYGIVAVDRLPEGKEFNHLTDKFTKGLNFSDKEPVRLERINVFTSTAINASHASSAMDIVLGAFRYAINQPYNMAAARAMMLKLAQLIWCERAGNVLHPFEKGLIFRPKDVSKPTYRKEYEDLLQHINNLIAEAN